MKQRHDKQDTPPPVPDELDKPRSALGPMLIILAPLLLLILYGALAD